MKPWSYLLVLVVGCSSPQSAVQSANPTWSLPITSPSAGVAPMAASLGRDGEVIIAARDVSIGSSDPVGGHVLRVSRDGAVTSALALARYPYPR